MANLQHHFTAAPDGHYLCQSCDAPRSTPAAYCHGCEEFTDSYQFSGDDVAAENRRHADVLAICDGLWMARRLDALAAKRMGA